MIFLTTVNSGILVFPQAQRKKPEVAEFFIFYIRKRQKLFGYPDFPNCPD